MKKRSFVFWLVRRKPNRSVGWTHTITLRLGKWSLLSLQFRNSRNFSFSFASKRMVMIFLQNSAWFCTSNCDGEKYWSEKLFVENSSVLLLFSVLKQFWSKICNPQINTVWRNVYLCLPSWQRSTINILLEPHTPAFTLVRLQPKKALNWWFHQTSFFWKKVLHPSLFPP